MQNRNGSDRDRGSLTHDERSPAGFGYVALCALLLAGLIACGSSPGTSGGGDGGAASADGGRADGGGGGEADGGLSTADGGSPTADGGTVADGGAPDGGSVAWKILPGQGLDVEGRNGGTVSLRVGQTYAQVRGLVGDGADSPLFAGAFDRVYNGQYFAFFSNTDQSNDGASTPNNTFTNPDVMRYLSTTQLFPGKTVGGSGPGSLRSVWLAELGQPEYTQSNLDVVGETRDLYFSRGLVINYNSNGLATSYTVSRQLKKPDVTIEVHNKRLGSISNGSSFTAVLSTWGEADQVDDYTALIYPGRNLTYLSQGLLFVTQASVIDPTNLKVTGVVFYDPYYGKLDVGTGLGVRSTKAELDAALVTSNCGAVSTNIVNQTWRVYRWSGAACDTRVGVIFDAQNRARTLWLGIP